MTPAPLCGAGLTAVQEVKATAQDAATTVKEEGKTAAQDVQGQAEQAKKTVQNQASSS